MKGVGRGEGQNLAIVFADIENDGENVNSGHRKCPGDSNVEID